MSVHPADVQDRDGARDLLASVRSLYPWLSHIFADGGYGGDKLKVALKSLGDWTLEIVKRSGAAKGFVLLPRRRDQKCSRASRALPHLDAPEPRSPWSSAPSPG